MDRKAARKPGLCEHKGRKVACCVHGMSTFPSWHRLYVEEVEEALLGRGSSVAVPYWDWTKPFSKLPKLISEATYFNSRKQQFDPNPFFSAKVAEEDAVTTRDPLPELFNNEDIDDQVLFALEQDNFCDFEIQFEVVHNFLHSKLGGRAKYSIATLDYSAFDPVFFLHHTNMDRIWAIWQELQRWRGLPYNEADCAINLMRKPLKPFSDDANHGDLTHRYSRPADTFDYRNHFHYEYDTLEYNGMKTPQLAKLLLDRKEHGRVFAGFLLHNIGMSADVDIYVCVPTGPKGRQNCNHKAGTFAVLGGETEMPFVFDRLYKHDITKTVKELGLKLDSAANFGLKVDILATNGSLLSSDILPPPTILYVPGAHERQAPDGHQANSVVRKEIGSLSPRESLSLLRAMRAVQADSSGDGYQAIAAFHAIPPLCPSPRASKRYACCQHGMATFPQWHRLYTVQLEDALQRHGSSTGLPYWDWTRQADSLPRLLTDLNFTDPSTDEVHPNPLAGADIKFEGTKTERDIMSDLLFKPGPHGWDTWLFNQALLALEQEDYCNFEIQFEITHNSIHQWVGGAKTRSLGHLHYASYDPIFFIHHSNTDRLWAVWQELQKFRGHDHHEANCALEKMREPLKPFDFGPPYNLNPSTKDYSKPEDTFDYEEHFNYRYDSLEFVGMTIPNLDAFIKKRQEDDRVFAGFLLRGLGTSASVHFEICNDGKCFEGGYFAILGGSAEMPWQFDRLYKYEITDQLKSHGLRFDDEYVFEVHVKYLNGSHIPGDVIPTPSVIFEPSKHRHDLKRVTPNFIRRDLNTLNERDLQSLQAALRELKNDKSNDGYNTIASFHGEEVRCPTPENATHACCLHGMPTFPHWHRLFTVQMEHALRRHGSSIALPYWDWTLPIEHLPDLFTQDDFYDSWRDEVVKNPFARGFVPHKKAYTVRRPNPLLFSPTSDKTHSFLIYPVLLALEQTDYCDFEVQFEVMHNAIHYLVGGPQTYSLSSLEYTAFDPLFFIHHSMTDKIWVIWQELQRKRNLPYDRADCALNHMTEPMKPFSFDGFNLNKFTKDHAVPNSVFNHEDLGYTYDDLSVGGYSLDKLEELIAEERSKPRVFAGFLLKGVKTSASVDLKVCLPNGECTFAGVFNLLGGPTEMPWAFDRLFKMDITWALKKIGLTAEDVLDAKNRFNLEVSVHDVKGTSMNTNKVMPKPTVIYEPAHGAVEVVDSSAVAGVGVRKNINSLTTSEVENLRAALRAVQADQGPNGAQNLASFHGMPAKCEHEGHPAACCLHGMANFPQWHRLYVKQWEDALTAQGAKLGIPYWDWTGAFKDLPALVTQEEDNPFHHGTIYNGEKTSRAPRAQLFNDPEFGDESFFYRQALLVFEQTDYCDFEVQFEITHNAIHSWIGGRSPYGMSTLEYTSYDPLFIIHHSNVDRQFAIWQSLQKFRSLPYNSANCAVQHLRKPMRPFSDSSNVNPITKSNSRAVDAFDYDRLNYQYDNLNFHGLTIAELNDLLEKRKEEDRIFAEFLLHNIGTSADVVFELCNEDHKCQFAGTFAVLGGAIEMPWAYDRLFKYDVTSAFEKMNLRPDSDYHFMLNITAVNGTQLASDLLRKPSVQFVPGVKGFYRHLAETTVDHSSKLVRKSVDQLTLTEAANLRDALSKIQQDSGPNGFEAIAGYHGAPYVCPATSQDKFACCMHGMPVFPHWHRLFTVQFEMALKDKGATVGIPYWDWTAPAKALPSLFGDESNFNPFASYFIKSVGQKTTREVKPSLFNPRQINGRNYLFHQTLLTLEEDNYCDFEAQFELLHNELHALVGGSGTYSMATLDYSAFDPFFMIHHSATDRIWVIWQELQKLRRKPFNSGRCAGHVMEHALQPFSYPDVNKNDFTRLNSEPGLIFDVAKFDYEYDNLELNGKDVQHLNSLISDLRHHNRVFLAATLYSFQDSVDLKATLYGNDDEEFDVGSFHLLGGSKEVPWAFERLFKYDITEVVKKAGFSTDKPILVKYEGTTYDGKVAVELKDHAILVERPAHTDYDIAIFPLDRTSMVLPPKVVLKKGTRVKFISANANATVENLGSLTVASKCLIPPFTFNSYAVGVVHALPPGDYFFVVKDLAECKAGKRMEVTIQDE